jgi:hypothetical protein
MIKIGKIYKAKANTGHAFDDGEPVLVVNHDTTDKLYACYSVNDSPLLQHVFAEELGKVVRADSKLYDKAADIIDALSAGIAELQEQLEPDAELEVFDDSQAIEMSKDEEEAEGFFNVFADQNLCTGYVIPANFHGQIVDTRFAEEQ